MQDGTRERTVLPSILIEQDGRIGRSVIMFYRVLLEKANKGHIGHHPVGIGYVLYYCTRLGFYIYVGLTFSSFPTPIPVLLSIAGYITRA